MKLCLAILLISFISIEAHGSRVKRGLSADEQKKFLDELNKDRKKLAEKGGMEYVPMKYDASLEKEIVNTKKCLDDVEKMWLPLRYNDVAEEMRQDQMDESGEGDIYRSYFDPIYNRIGCSKEGRCTEVLNVNNHAPPKLEGKTIEYYGICNLGKSVKGNYLRHNIRRPSPNKYGDILGIPGGKQESEVQGSGMDGAAGEKGSGAGSAFSLLISLFFVLYI